MNDRPLSEQAWEWYPGDETLRDEIAVLEQERNRLRRVVDAAMWVCPECDRIVGQEQETCRCGFDRAALEGGDR